jgi:DNA-binding LacI/PurR family transcriptional regulator
MKHHREAAATIDTIAQACGRSRSTVSAVLRGEARRYRISSATEAVVMETAARVGWKPNFFARALNTKKTGTIGVLFPDVFERFMGETIRGIESVLEGADYRMFLSTSRFDPDEEIRTIDAFAYRGVDGLIIAPYAPFSGQRSRSAELPDRIGAIPCVVIDRAPEGLDPIAAGYGFVVQNDREAARAATRHLALGSTDASPKPTSVAYLGFDLASTSLRERLSGYREAAEELGFPALEVLLRERNPASRDLRDAVDHLYPSPDPGDRSGPAAWLVSTEGLANRLAGLLTAKGLTVGVDVAIARFGIDPPCIASALIGLRQPHRELGRKAAELLLAMIDNGAASASGRQGGALSQDEKRITVPVDLIARRTNAASAIFFTDQEVYP